VLLCAPYFSSVVLAANAILNAGTDAQKAELLPGIAAGETIAALAFTEPNGKWDAAGITMEAAGSGDAYTLDGTKHFVIDGHTADTIVVVARQAGTSGEDGIGFFAVDGDAAGLTRTPLATMDQTRKQARLDFDGVAATPLGEVGAGWPALSTTLDQAAVAMANESIGGAQKCLEMAVEYAKVRVQFRPADRLLPGDQAQVRRHAARGRVGQVGGVLRGVGGGRGQRGAAGGGQPRQGLRVRRVLPLGGREHPDPRRHRVHLGARRAPVLQAAKSSEILLGDATYHRELLAQRIGI